MKKVLAPAFFRAGLFLCAPLVGCAASITPGAKATSAPAAAAPKTQVGTVALRCYENVTASLWPNRALFRCESAAKADMLLGKLLADAFWENDYKPDNQT